MTSLSEIRKNVTTWYDARRDFLDDIIGTDHPAVVGGILVGAALAAAGLLAGLLWAFTSVVQAVTELLDHLAVDLHRTPAVQTAVDLVTKPISNYLAAHASGTGLSAELVRDTWLAVGGFLILLAVFESRGARIGWVLYGATNVAMVWLGTDVAAHRPIAAGLTALAWTVISIPALHRIGHRPPTVVIRNIPALRPTASQRDDSSPATVAAFPQGPRR